MSTNISSRILRSSHSKRLQAIPWETLLHIFSYCDQPTLFAVSLVSFACWELAGPILYQDVEIVDLDGLASLFFIENAPSSLRLREAVSHLSRIKTLSLEIQDLGQTKGPLFSIPEEDDGDREQDFFDGIIYDDIILLPPHRLLRLSPQLSLSSLTLPDWLHLGFVNLNNVLPLQIFPYLNPRTLTLNRSRRDAYWFGTIVTFSPDFLERWSDLERITMSDTSITCSYGPDGYREGGLPFIWASTHSVDEDAKRSLELCFDIAGGKSGSLEAALTDHPGQGIYTLNMMLRNAGVLEELVALVDLRVVVRVREEDEKIAKREIRKLREWMKALVVLETV